MHFRNGLAKVVAHGVRRTKPHAGVRPKHRRRHAHALATSPPPRRHQVGQSLRICDLRVDDVRSSRRLPIAKAAVSAKVQTTTPTSSAARAFKWASTRCRDYAPAEIGKLIAADICTSDPATPFAARSCFRPLSRGLMLGGPLDVQPVVVVQELPVVVAGHLEPGLTAMLKSWRDSGT